MKGILVKVKYTPTYIHTNAESWYNFFVHQTEYTYIKLNVYGVTTIFVQSCHGP